MSPILTATILVGLLVLGVTIALILGAMIYLGYSAPAIISEAALGSLLADGLVKRTKVMDDPTGWGACCVLPGSVRHLAGDLPLVRLKIGQHFPERYA